MNIYFLILTLIGCGLLFQDAAKEEPGVKREELRLKEKLEAAFRSGNRAQIEGAKSEYYSAISHRRWIYFEMGAAIVMIVGVFIKIF